MSEKIKAWHFLREDRRLRYGDLRKVEPGVTYSAPEARLCVTGMHASRSLLDALGYAPGPVLSRVLVWGGVQEAADKLVGLHREVLWLVEGDRWLWEAACRIGEWALEQELQAGREVDPRSYAAIETRRARLIGCADDDDLRAAHSAAYSAADSAACWAAHSAAHSAAYSAACSSADSAADSAAYSAAYSAIEDILLEALADEIGQRVEDM